MDQLKDPNEGKTNNEKAALADTLSKSKVSLDVCISEKHTIELSTNGGFNQIMAKRHRDGVKQRFITNITLNNLQYCKALAEFTELRHLADIKGILVIVDGRSFGANYLVNAQQAAPELIQSGVREFTEQQQYLFEMLWNKAVAARHRIRELDEGIPIENTELVQGTENIVRSQIEGLAKCQKQHDACCDQTFPASLLSSQPVWDMCLDLQRRGAQLRTITEITPRNIEYCKKMLTRMNLRHLNDIRGNFSVRDKIEYRGAATMREGEPPTQGILSTSKVFVDTQQYFFETLWNKAIPAEQRIREIEEGIAPETIETFSDAAKTQDFANYLVRTAQKELLIMFASVNEYNRQENSPNGFLKTIAGLSEASKQKIDIRITLPNRDTDSDEIDATTLDIDEEIDVIPKISERMNVRRFEAPLSTRISIIIVDRKYALVVELKDDLAKDTSESSSGLAIYSNSKAIVLSYVAIFELLWTHIELYQELKAREVAQKEFIDIAVHELRTPIQPILGLAQEIQARQRESGEGRLLGIILRSATNLQRLADNLLDVARIQNNSLKLALTHFDLDELISSILADYAIDAARNKGIGIEFNRAGKPIKIEADRDRLYQVISNCLQNALKFTENGQIIISSKDEGDAVTVSIKDNGRGIDPDILTRLFTKFATSSPSTGTGLGLFITKRIIDAHGGQITGKNNTGELGATFTFTIPFTNRNDETFHDQRSYIVEKNATNS